MAEVGGESGHGHARCIPGGLRSLRHELERAQSHSRSIKPMTKCKSSKKREWSAPLSCLVLVKSFSQADVMWHQKQIAKVALFTETGSGPKAMEEWNPPIHNFGYFSPKLLRI